MHNEYRLYNDLNHTPATRSNPVATNQTNEKKSNDPQNVKGVPVFKIQLFTSSQVLSPNDKRLKGLKGVEHYKENGLYKYTYGASTDYNKVVKTKQEIAPKFKETFIIAFIDDKKVNINAAINEFKKNKK